MGREKALVVIENKGTRNAIKILLELNGIEVISTDDAAQAIKKIGNDFFDIVLCDLNLALPAGSNLLPFIKGHPRHYNTPFIVIADATQEKEIRQAINLGANDCIASEFQNKEFITTIKARLELSNKYKVLHKNEVSGEVFALLNKNLMQELLTPVYTLINVTKIIGTLEGVEHIDSHSDLVTAIYESGFRMQRNMQNLRIYSMLNTENSTEVHKINTDIILSDTLTEVMGHYENELWPGMKKIEQTVLQIGTWEGQLEMLKIVFTELIDNAIHFSPEGHLPELRLDALNDGFCFSVTNYLTDQVKLNVDNIMPFKKFHKDLSRIGLGLGLFIVRSICEKMGYQFTITKHDGKITFMVEQH